jgi:DNA polymerase IV
MLDHLPLRWLFIDFNSYFASVEQQLDPRLRNRPVAVSPVGGDSSCAIAASYEAKAFGIKTGTPIREARQLCPELIVIHATHQRYVEFHEALKKEIENHLPITKVCSIDEVGCRLMDNENAPKVARDIALRIKRGIATNVGECLRSSIGIAPNRFLAKVASDMQKPDGLTVLEAADLPERLYDLELRDLPGIGRRMEKRLLAAGIPDVRTFMNLPPKLARRIWGSIHGERMWWELRGLDLPDQPTERRSVGHSHVLAPEFRHEAGAQQIVRRLLVKAASRMRRLGYRTRCLVLTCWLESRWEWSGAARLPATQDSFTLLEALERLWGQAAAEARRLNFAPRYKQVSVALVELAPLNEDQFALFDHDGAPLDAAVQARRLRLSRVLDEVNGKLGRDKVRLGAWRDKRPDSFTGTKIAFTRVPDIEEFRE